VRTCDHEAPCWRASSHCLNSDCVEVVRRRDSVLVRNSGSPEVILELSSPQWRGLIGYVLSARSDFLTGPPGLLLGG
jgi:hypothetical protein